MTNTAAVRPANNPRRFNEVFINLISNRDFPFGFLPSTSVGLLQDFLPAPRVCKDYYQVRHWFFSDIGADLSPVVPFLTLFPSLRGLNPRAPNTARLGRSDSQPSTPPPPAAPQSMKAGQPLTLFYALDGFCPIPPVIIGRMNKVVNPPLGADVISRGTRGALVAPTRRGETQLLRGLDFLLRAHAARVAGPTCADGSNAKADRPATCNVQPSTLPSLPLLPITAPLHRSNTPSIPSCSK